MFKNTVLFSIIIGIVSMISCGNASSNKVIKDKTKETLHGAQIQKSKNNIIIGANQTDAYLPLMKDKRVGIVANQTSVIFKTNDSYTHLVDSLLNLKVDVKKVFAPEHGFRGKADAGEHVKDGIDTKTKLPIISLYGSNKKPNAEQLEGLDLIIFDIQDVGARFYTYISTLHYVMEACAEANIPVLILDRPNPNGHYVDGPILEMTYKSFVGMHPVPIVHGMTIGEYASMINGERWLNKGIQCELEIIKLKNYTHQTAYSLPIKPSPNLPNDRSITLYPSLCLFEGTTISAGRGTDLQFQIFGSPNLNPDIYQFQFTPQPNEGAKHPKHQGELCHGKDLTPIKKMDMLYLKWIIKAFAYSKNKETFFNSFFTKLAGTKKLQDQIESGLNMEDIKATWQEGLEDFKKTRKKYLIYD